MKECSTLFPLNYRLLVFWANFQKFFFGFQTIVALWYNNKVICFGKSTKKDHNKEWMATLLNSQQFKNENRRVIQQWILLKYTRNIHIMKSTLMISRVLWNSWKEFFGCERCNKNITFNFPEQNMDDWRTTLAI